MTPPTLLERKARAWDALSALLASEHSNVDGKRHWYFHFDAATHGNPIGLAATPLEAVEGYLERIEKGRT